MRRAFFSSLTLLLLGLAGATPATDLLTAGNYAQAYAAAMQAGDDLSAAHAAMAQGAYRDGDHAMWLDRAIAEGRKAVQQQPGSAEAHYLLGSALGQRANFLGTGALFTALKFARESRGEYEQALKLKPDYAEARMALARWHSGAYARAGRISGGNPDTARKLANQVLQGGPSTSYTLMMAAYVAFDLKDRVHGQALMQQALELPARNAEEKDLQAGARAYLAKVK